MKIVKSAPGDEGFQLGLNLPAFNLTSPANLFKFSIMESGTPKQCVQSIQS